MFVGVIPRLTWYGWYGMYSLSTSYSLLERAWVGRWERIDRDVNWSSSPGGDRQPTNIRQANRQAPHPFRIFAKREQRRHDVTSTRLNLSSFRKNNNQGLARGWELCAIVSSSVQRAESIAWEGKSGVSWSSFATHNLPTNDKQQQPVNLP
jgi:hypothetical protein